MGVEMKSEIKKVLKSVPIILLGNLCIALAATLFIIPNHILVGGTAGISVILQAFFDIDVQQMIQILTIGMFLIGVVALGEDFTFKTIVSTICYPILLEVCSAVLALFPADFLAVDTLTATIFSGVLVGFGIGIVYRCDASTGGMDIPPLIIHKYTNIPLSVLVMIVDGATVLMGMIGYGLMGTLYGILSVWVCSFVIQKTMMMGLDKVSQILIISEKKDEIKHQIFEQLDRGCTILKAQGGFTQEQKDVLLVVVPFKQLSALTKLISAIDGTAFVVVSDANEVHGRGFTDSKVYFSPIDYSPINPTSYSGK